MCLPVPIYFMYDLDKYTAKSKFEFKPQCVLLFLDYYSVMFTGCWVLLDLDIKPQAPSLIEEFECIKTNA